MSEQRTYASRIATTPKTWFALLALGWVSLVLALARGCAAAIRAAGERPSGGVF